MGSIPRTCEHCGDRDAVLAVSCPSFLSLVFTLLAENSGEALEEAVDEDRLVKSHANIAGGLKYFAAALFVLVAVVVVGDWIMRRRARSAGDGEVSAGVQRALTVVSIVALVVGGFAVVWTVRACHSGATATWQDVTRNLDNPAGRERDEERELRGVPAPPPPTRASTTTQPPAQTPTP